MNQTTPNASPAAARIAVVAASWHGDIVRCATDAIQAEFRRRAWPDEGLSLHHVPGAFEIPLQAQRLARSGTVDAVIACAFVVDGGIYRHDFVASTVIDGLMHVQLDTGVPVFSCVLTPHHFHEHDVHRARFQAHFVHKGTEVARACLATLALPA